jgi:hypothetical protein
MDQIYYHYHIDYEGINILDMQRSNAETMQGSNSHYLIKSMDQIYYQIIEELDSVHKFTMKSTDEMQYHITTLLSTPAGEDVDPTEEMDDRRRLLGVPGRRPPTAAPSAILCITYSVIHNQ